MKYDDTCDLLDVILHPLGLDYFLKFLKTDFSDENLKVSTLPARSQLARTPIRSLMID